MTLRHQFRSRLAISSVESFPALLQSNSEELKGLLISKEMNFVRIFQFKAEVYIYCEGLQPVTSFDWPDSLLPHFEKWPAHSGPRSSVEMMDIFHDAMPRIAEPWRAPGSVRKSVGSIIYLRPEKYASYIFYHFQLQEEGLKRFNKYFIIGANEELLFSYQELPAVVDTFDEGKILNTNNSPENWAELMAEHFAPWSEGLNVDAPWKEMELVFAFEQMKPRTDG